MKHTLWIAFLSIITLSACANFQDTGSTDHAATCKVLKNQIIFGGTAQNQSRTMPSQPQATQQRAQLDKANQSYDQLGC